MPRLAKFLVLQTSLTLEPHLPRSTVFYYRAVRLSLCSMKITFGLDLESLVLFVYWTALTISVIQAIKALEYLIVLEPDSDF